jgi:CheY-like chemotaxis protein
MDAEGAQIILADTLAELILMDIALPGMDGLTLTRLLKGDARTRHIRIVALTAFSMKGIEQKAFDAGCDGYVTKPIDTRALPTQVCVGSHSPAGGEQGHEQDLRGQRLRRRRDGDGRCHRHHHRARGSRPRCGGGEPGHERGQLRPAP